MALITIYIYVLTVTNVKALFEMFASCTQSRHVIKIYQSHPVYVIHIPSIHSMLRIYISFIFL